MTDASEEQPPKVSIHDFVEELVVGLMNTRMYWKDHPRVHASITELMRLLPTVRDQHGQKTIELRITRDHIVFEHRALIGVSIAGARLITALSERNIGGLSFQGTVTDTDYQALFQILVERAGADVDIGTLNQKLAKEQCSSILLLPQEDLEEAQTESVVSVSMGVRQGMVRVLQDTTISLCHGGVIQFDQSRTCIDNMLHHLNAGHDPALWNASRFEKYDEYTFGHSVRVAVLALTFARTLTDDPALLNRIGVSALLHDVGKVRVPYEVLHCNTRLDEDQRREMEKHPEYGAEILMDHDNCDPMAYSVAFGHHLGKQGKGYPKLKHDPYISLVTRIVKICDVFEALTAVRPYKAEMSATRAFRIMIGMGEQFDRVMLKKFIRAIGVYPAGTRVHLSTGESARVIGQTSDLYRPVIEIDTTPDGDPVSAEHRLEVDLAKALKDGTECAGCVVERVLENANTAAIG